MRSYRQYCALAKALDVIGDRWTLLIVRELLLRGAARYTDLRDGLPGIATNLLAERLRELEQAGIVRREEAPPPIATTLFQLTERGEALKPAMVALGQWGAPYMEGPVDGDEFRTHWLKLPAEIFLTDKRPDRPPVSIELRTTGGEPMVVETVDGEVRTRQGSADDPDLVLSGTPQLVVGVLTGRLAPARARELGLETKGDTRILRRLQREAPAAA